MICSFTHVLPRYGTDRKPRSKNQRPKSLRPEIEDLSMSLFLFDRTSTRAVLTLNRPAQHNALSRAMKAELNKKLESLEKDDGLRVVIITGAGGVAFCAGTDIQELTHINEMEGAELSREGQSLCERIENFPVPVIASINGLAAGGGFELVLACHLRIASTAASFSLPETRLGLIPGYGGTQRLAREIGVGRATELMLTRRTISSDEALRLGLVNRLVTPGDLESQVFAFANEIEQLSPLSIRACLKAISGCALPLKDGLELETELFASLFATEDAKEGTSAFLEKRKPVFKGK
jgi:enoyl-CoA hydratase